MGGESRRYGTRSRLRDSHGLSKGFIRAEVIGYHDFIAHGGEQGAKDAGRWRLEGNEYVVKDRDVVHLAFNV